MLAASPLIATAEGTSDALPSPLVSESVLQAKIAQAQVSTDLTDEARKRLVALYRESVSHLEEAKANAAAAAAYRRTTQTAPTEMESLRAARAEILADAPLADLDLAAGAPLADLERQLQKERANLATVQARHDDLVARLALEQARPTAARGRLTAADEALEAAYRALQAEATERVGQARSQTLAQARRWELETRYQALSNEIQMLHQELLSRPVRLELLAAKRDKEAASIDWIAARIAALEQRILTERQRTATEARIEAERMHQETRDMDPVLTRLSEANAELTRDIDALTAAMGELEQARWRAEQLAQRIDADYRDTRGTLAAGQPSDDLGAVLLEQLDALPDLSDIREQHAQRRARVAKSHARRLRYRTEVRRLTDLEASLAALASELETTPTQVQQDRLRDLVTQRRLLLERMLETEERYLARAQALDAVEDALLALVADFEALLLKHLVWLPTEPPADPRELLALPSQLGSMLATARDAELGSRLTRQLGFSPVFWMAVLVSAALLWLRRRLVAAINDIAGRVGKPTTDSFGHTLRVLGLTVLLALPLPLPAAAVGWVLSTAPTGSELTRSLGDSLLRVAMLVLALTLLMALCQPKGLAAVHFRWPEPNLKLLRAQSRQLAWILIPATLLLYLSLALSPLQSGGTPARIAGIVAFTALAWFLYQVFHPRRGVMARLQRLEPYRLLRVSYWVWYPLLVLYPLAFLGLGLSGYLYTVTVEAQNFVDSLLLLLTAALLNALALRWLLIVRRRLAYEAALERRRAALEAAAQDHGGEAAELRVEEPEADLSSLSDGTSRLIRISVAVLAVMGLALIWSEALPAVRVLEAQTLWHTTVIVDGEEQRKAVTLLDLGLALLFAGGTLVLLKRLPALLEIVLLRHYQMPAADRYAATTLIGYVVGAIGILLVLGTLGASWTQLQWMAAALSVGIGFGLQEIVANFISGLIILFERPIRVGDTVTVGDTDGVVTKIRIRATTIRNWDRKELLVPNKEFITSRLLNWSLSDPVTRIVLVVGIAYGSDVDKALAIMKRVAEAHAHIVDDPRPFVTFDTFGDNALTLTLRAYVDSIDVRLETITELNRAINRAFAEADLEIAFPQRDVHLDAKAPLRVRIEPGPASP